MAKRGDPNKKDDKLEKAVKRNWIICAASLLAIIALTFYAKLSGG